MWHAAAGLISNNPLFRTVNSWLLVLPLILCLHTIIIIAKSHLTAALLAPEACAPAHTCVHYKRASKKLHKAALCLCTPAYLPQQITYTHITLLTPCIAMFTTVIYRRERSLSVHILQTLKCKILPPKPARLDKDNSPLSWLLQNTSL